MRALAMVVVIGLASPAVAQTRRERAAAQRLFRAGEDLYARGKFEDAAHSFHAAWEKVPEPRYLLAEGRAYERANLLDEAISAYQGYLSGAPDAPDVVDVERKIATLRERLEARQEHGSGDGDEDEDEDEDGGQIGVGDPIGTLDGSERDDDRDAGRFHVHTIALGLAPVFWLGTEDDMFRVAFEYRYALAAQDQVTGQLMYIPPLVSGKTNQLSGLGAAAFYLRTFPLSDTWGLLLRAGIAFEAFSSRSADTQFLGVRGGPGLAYAFSDAISVSLEALASPGLYFIDSGTLAGGGGSTEGVITLEPAVTLALGL